MLAVNALDVDINSTPILRGIQLEINTGEIVGLIGRNGAGKTTFLRSVMGLLPVFNGSMLHKDQELRDLPGYRRAHMGFGYMPEDRRLVPEMTAEQIFLCQFGRLILRDMRPALSGFTKSSPNVKSSGKCQQHHFLADSKSWLR